MNFSWVIPGRIAGMGWPRPEAIPWLRRRGITALLSLTTRPPEELGDLLHKHVPIEDMTSPSLGQLADAVAFLRMVVGEGGSVAVHCRAGMGRTGTILAAYLVSEGADPEDAIDRIRELRPGSVETSEQEEVVRAYAAQRSSGGDRIPVLVSGAKGKVGSVLCAGIAKAEGVALAAEVDVGDDLAEALDRSGARVAVDFTTPSAVFRNVKTILEHGVHAVVGTTGLTEDDLAEVDATARDHAVACLVAPNFALGAVLMMRFAEEAARCYRWAEVIERHHEAKADAPSGTARETARRIARARRGRPPTLRETETAPGARGGRVDEVPVHSLRLPGSVAHQEVWFGGPGESLVLRHDAIDRSVYVPGVLLAVRGVVGKKGLLRGLESVIWPGS